MSLGVFADSGYKPQVEAVLGNREPSTAFDNHMELDDKVRNLKVLKHMTHVWLLP